MSEHVKPREFWIAETVTGVDEGHLEASDSPFTLISDDEVVHHLVEKSALDAVTKKYEELSKYHDEVVQAEVDEKVRILKERDEFKAELDYLHYGDYAAMGYVGVVKILNAKHAALLASLREVVKALGSLGVHFADEETPNSKNFIDETLTKLKTDWPDLDLGGEG